MPQEQTITSKGLPVELEYHWDVKDGVKEGWVVHLVEAYADGEPAGYLKIIYIPSEEHERRFATPFDYAVNESGSYLRTRYLLAEKPEARWGADELRKAIEDTYRLMPPGAYEQLKALPLEELESKWQERKAFLSEEFAERHRAFTDFQRDKPLVDFIRVYSADDASRYSHGEKRLYPYGRDWQRQGVGTVLYEAGAVWMAEQGFQLWASGLQSGHAAKAWQHLAEKHEIGSAQHRDGHRRRMRRYLDGSKISLAVPPPALSALEASGADAPPVAHKQSLEL